MRNNLNESIKNNGSLRKKEMDFLMKMTSQYSGLSDLTIPSILLCSSLTANGGVLALVLPESSISREYSTPALATLFKFFEIKVIIKDERRSWFKDVQVKTILLLATKLEKARLNILEHPNFPIIEISNKNSKTNMPIGSSFYSKKDPYRHFAHLIFSNIEAFKEIEGVQTHVTNPNFILNNIISNSKKDRWLFEMIPELKTLISNPLNKTYNLDKRLDKMISCNNWNSIDDLGINIGQGLRTGANSFFYTDLIKKKKKLYSIVENKSSEVAKFFKVSDSCLKVVLRKQSELPNTFLIKRENLIGRVLIFKDYYTNTDVKKFNIKLGISKHQLTHTASNYIQELSKLNIGTKDNPKFIPDMSAVRTNESTNNGTLKRWYQLPPLRLRHIPELCIPRVNTRTVKAFLVESDIVVDANFITLTTTDKSKYSKYSLLAILNSDWVKLNLELNGNILGGGALKLDKTHLNNILIPGDLVLKESELDFLGRELCSAKGKNVLDKINDLINESLKFNKGYFKEDFKSLINYKLNSRCNNAR